MPNRSFRLVVAVMVVVALLIAGAGIARVALGGTGMDGAMVVLWGLFGVTLVARSIEFLLDQRRHRRARRSRNTNESPSPMG